MLTLFCSTKNCFKTKFVLNHLKFKANILNQPDLKVEINVHNLIKLL